MFIMDEVLHLLSVALHDVVNLLQFVGKPLLTTELIFLKS